MKKIFCIFVLFGVSLIFGYEAPYKLEKFQTVLDHSKLQAPLSSFDPKWSIPYGKFQNRANRYFYLEDNQYMAFFMCGKKHRSELREQNIWQVETKKKHILYAEVKILPLDNKKEFTFIQIHSDPSVNSTILLNKPLLRIVWRKNYHNIKNHLWAIICTNTDQKHFTYTKIDLGERGSNFSSFRITVMNSQLIIIRDNQKKVTFDISYWNGIWNYFKAGTYLQSNGCAKVLFKKLVF